MSTSKQKNRMLRALAEKRQKTRWSNYACIGDYHSGVYECDFVSPYTKTGGNVDAEIVVMLQDWSSDDSLSRSIDEDSVIFGYSRKLATNRNLANLLGVYFNIELNDVYATNLFPFIKGGDMSNSIPHDDLVNAAREFGLPQIQIVHPKLVICLGLATFDAICEACAIPPTENLPLAIESPFDLGDIRIWCQAHTGYWGQQNSKERVSDDWQRMGDDFDAAG